MSPNEYQDDLDADERRLFAALPREMSSTADQTEHMVQVLRAEGFFERKSVAVRALVAAAALIAIGLGGGVVGHRLAERASLEAMIARPNLPVADRVLLLQRAGSAYVRAAHAYADATATTDSTAVEVAQQVLRGAAHAVVRSQLDGGVAARLTSALQSTHARTVAKPTVLWF
jgi:hypothetical protein